MQLDDVLGGALVVVATPHGGHDSAGPRGPRIALHRWDAHTLLYVGTPRACDIVMIDHFR